MKIFQYILHTIVMLIAISSSVANAGWSKQQYYENRLEGYTHDQNELLEYGTKGFVDSCKSKKIKDLTEAEAKTLLVVAEWGKVNNQYTCDVVWIDAKVDTNGGFVKETIVMDNCKDTVVTEVMGEPGATIYQSYKKNVKICK